MTEEFTTLSHHPLLDRAYELTIGAEATDEELLEIYHPDVVLDFRERPTTPDVFEGLDGVRRLLADLQTGLEEFKFEVEEVRECGDRLVAFIHTRGRMPDSGEPVSLLPAHVWTIADGRISSGRYFEDRGEALREAGGATG